jgi:type III secretion low calcium response chaperone LcrH/SycD
MAYELYKNGKYAESKDVFRFLTLADYNDRRYWMGLGACHQMSKDYTPAIESYSVAAIQNPKDPYVHFYAAECFRNSGDVDLALKTLDTAISVAEKSKDHASFAIKLKHLHETWSKHTQGANHG